jgi:3-hydroxybutyryl-CoA dehydrogenase
MCDHGLCRRDALETWPPRFVTGSSYDVLAPCDFVIENVTEDLEIKRSVLTEIARVVRQSVPIASNTSAFRITELQQSLEQPARIVGMHFLAPCHQTRFLEIIRGRYTDDQTIAAAISLGSRIGKQPSLVNRDVDGFIVNRLAYALLREALHLLEAGVADAPTIDRAFCNSVGFWSPIAGPFRWMDLTGLHHYPGVMARLFPQLNDSPEVPRVMRELATSGARGIENGHGFYSYTPAESNAWRERLHRHGWAMRELTVDGCGEARG